MIHKIFRLLLILLYSVSSSLPVFSQTPDSIGSTVSVINVVTAELNRNTRALQTGDSVHSNELITVNADASSEIKLNDDTKLALGAGAKLLLDKFVYNPNKPKAAISVDLLFGAFRFMTGVADKSSYVVKVPKASITVRGTIFDVYIQTDQTTWVLLHEGSIRVCNERGDCSLHDQPGKLIRISEDGILTKPTRWASLRDFNQPEFGIGTLFPFVLRPPKIDPTPVFSPDDILRADTINGKEGNGTKTTEDVQDPEDKKPTSGKKKPSSKDTEKGTPPKKVRTTKNSDDSKAAAEGLGLAIGIGLGIGLGKFGNGGNSKGGNRPTGGGGGKPTAPNRTMDGFKPN
ncbi:MAG: FecR domain-containing protein [Hyphomicrobium sp.]